MSHSVFNRGRWSALAPAAVMLLAICLLVTVTGAVMVPLDDASLAKGADQIVRGQVTGVRSGWNADHSNIVTTATVKVHARAKGQGADTIELAALGGAADGITQWTEDQPAFVAGAEAYFFIKAHPGRASTVYGGPQGAVPVANGRAMTGSTRKGGGIPIAEFDRYLAGLARGEAATPPVAVEPEPRAAAPAPVIESVVPNASSAGTSTQVTITGSGFGTKASRESDADVAFLYRYVYSMWYKNSRTTSIWATGYPYYEENENEIVSWTDTQIVVNVPIGVASDGYMGGASSGYVYVYTDDGRKSPVNPFTVTFSYGRMRWAGQAPFHVNAGAEGPAVLSAVQNASETWNGAIPSSWFGLVYLGPSADASFGKNGQSLVYFGPASDFTSPSIIAWTSIWTDEDGHLVEADIEFNSGWTWTTGIASGDTMNVEAIVLHEFGHWLHLRDLYGYMPGMPTDVGKVMFGYNNDQFGNKNLKTLHTADTAGIRWIYPDTGGRVLSVTPDAGLPGSTVAIMELAGSGTSFATGATVALRRPGHPDIPATDVTVVSPTLITCTLVLPPTTALGAWDVVVTNPGGAIARLVGGFVVAADPWYTPHVLPCRIEAEDYDILGPGLSYSDTTPANEGGVYRTDAVDIEPIPGGHALAFVRDGEWTRYTVDSPSAGTYPVTLRIASWVASPPRTIELQVDGVTQQTVTVPTTASGEVFTDAAAKLTVPAGRHMITLRYHGGSMNLDAMVVGGSLSLGANFTAAPTEGTAPLSVQFTDTSTGAPAGWAWTFGDGGNSTLQHPNHTYAAPGAFTVALTVRDAGGENSTTTRTGMITVSAPSLTVAAITPNRGTSGSTVMVTRLSGTGFEPDATVTLRRAGSIDIPAMDVSVVSPTTITCQLPLPSTATPGAWDVVVANPGGHEATLPGGFTVSARQTYFFVGTWGVNGSGDGQLHYPGNIALDSAGAVYVSEDGNHRVQKFTPGGTFIRKWGDQGYDNGGFAEAAGIAIDGADRVYVADMGGFRVQKFTSDGEFISQWGTEGFGDGEFYGAGWLAVDSVSRVYVTEARGFNPRVQIFTSDGGFLQNWITFAKEDGFLVPRGIAVDGDGHVYVADSGHHRILKFSPDGTLLSQWGSEGTGDGQFRYPWGVAVDAAGDLYVTDNENNRVQKFTPDGAFVTAWGSMGAEDGEFSSPRGIAVDGDGTVYVVDAFNHRVQMFSQERTMPVIVPGAYGPSRDLDADGKVEDVNGNGRKDFADVVLYFNLLRWIAANEPVTPFDFNGNSRIDFADVVWLFNQL